MPHPPSRIKKLAATMSSNISAQGKDGSCFVVMWVREADVGSGDAEGRGLLLVGARDVTRAMGAGVDLAS